MSHYNFRNTIINMRFLIKSNSFQICQSSKYLSSNAVRMAHKVQGELLHDNNDEEQDKFDRNIIK